MEVQFHSRIKHWLLDNYLKICVDVQKGRKRPFYYVDLYSGDGKCECNNPKVTWEGSPLVAVRRGKSSPHPFYCIFNDNNPKRISDLKRNLNDYIIYVKDMFDKDANEIYRKVLEIIPTTEHSLFFLDPFKHTELYWSTVESISKHIADDDYYGSKFVRRPELLINLMTLSMQRDYKQHPEHIDRFYGNTNWKSIVDDYIKNGHSAHTGFLIAYVKQLYGIYKQNPFFIEVKQVGRGLKKGKSNVIYYLVFVTSHPKASLIFRNFQRYVEKYKKEKWAKEYFELKGYSSIDSFC